MKNYACKCIHLTILAHVFGLGFMGRTIVFGRSPFGPKMCEELCQQIGSCPSFRFSASELICHLDGDNAEVDDDSLIVMQHKGNLMPCPTGSKLIHTRAKLLKCVHYMPTELINTVRPATAAIAVSPTTTAVATTFIVAATSGAVSTTATRNTAGTFRTGTHEARTRLLIVLRDGIYQLHLHNKSLELYKRTRMVDTITYMPLSRRVLVGERSKTRKTWTLVSRSLDQSNSHEVKSKLSRLRTVAVDEGNQLLFVAFFNTGVHKMFLNVQTPAIMSRNPKPKPLDIAVDPSCKVVFVVYRNWLTLQTYELKIKRYVNTKLRCQTVTLNLIKGVLYYNVNKNLHEKYLNGKAPTIYFRLTSQPSNIVSNNGNMYVMYQKKEVGFIYNTGRIRNYRTISIPNIPLTMCLVP